ncbi:MAG: alpha/beta fold hydrolase [Comamonadaceae bacterium]|nr:alpha/beta fold hydrolase [Comamonadaceae bacterium]
MMFVMDGMRSVTAVFVRIVLLWVLLLASGCAWLDARQRQIIYRPTPALVGDLTGLRAGDQSLFLDLPSVGAPERISLWWLPHPNRDAPTLLYLHGTFRNLQGNRHKIDALREAGFAVLAVDYRGWGQSTLITPSEQTIVQDALLAWSELVRREPRAGQRVIYGHSMGSGAAVALASSLPTQSDYGALILESAFTSFPDIARAAGFWAGVLASFSDERFASVEKIARVQAPILMIHGAQDHTVPIELGKHLFDAANAPKQWFSIEGGQHSDLNLMARDQYQAILANFKALYLSQP